MKKLNDFGNREIRFTKERENHIRTEHPEMQNQNRKIRETLLNPEVVVKSKSDETVELFYKKYTETPVGEKFLCVAVKKTIRDLFIITAYFTDTIKRGHVIWKKEK